MGYVSSNGYMAMEAYVGTDPGNPVWIGDFSRSEDRLAGEDRRLRREIAEHLTNPYLDAPARMNKLAVCRRFRCTMRDLTAILPAWERDGFATKGPKVGIVFNVAAMKPSMACHDM